MSQTTAFRFLTHLGRLLLASLFLLAGLNKILNPGETAAFMAEAGLRPAEVLLPLTILLEVGAGVLLALGRKGAAHAAGVLAVFTLATNVVFHQFWQFDGEFAQLQLSLFFKNVAIAGALLMIASLEWQRP
ncbi:DoxX family protein [Parerythrobacter aurantius]|uniref:DoxX family protein n=1 Tax=Parerythrobacter aurantius TaxID=3127706 RepID=UPI003245D2C0